MRVLVGSRPHLLFEIIALQLFVMQLRHAPITVNLRQLRRRTSSSRNSCCWSGSLLGLCVHLNLRFDLHFCPPVSSLLLLLFLLLPQVKDQICKLAKKGMTPSAIGVLLRDSHGIPMVNTVTGSKILRILKGSGLAPDIPEDLYFLIKKAVSMRKHLERNRKDKDGKFRLILIESRIHRLARYYKVQHELQHQQQQQHGQAPEQCLELWCRVGVHGLPHSAVALGPMLVEVASGYYPGVCWLPAHAAARHCQHPGCGAPGSSCAPSHALQWSPGIVPRTRRSRTCCWHTSRFICWALSLPQGIGVMWDVVCMTYTEQNSAAGVC